MKKSSRGTANKSSRWTPILFFAAGGAMLLNIIFLWIRWYTDFSISILWAALAGIIAFAAGVLGLVTLYPRLSDRSPGWARAGVGFAGVALTSVGIAILWLMGAFLWGAGIPGSPSSGFQAVIAIFLISMVLSFICTAASCLWVPSLRFVGYLLIVPVAVWGLMLAVGAIYGLESGLSLDYYTNGLIALVFLGVGFSLRTGAEAHSIRGT